ncbi:hypothetical protein [Microbacterium elymi]|uniref:Uncharacterized protein n=1 Tax=Microbacterium elymi TaxID=2909587 RepID=A0ABY5NK73_9MICO|nr:hypothetical protein [Microbacterium elymi]UUT35565.1 hypothetical protein L2X98_19765 [Microbacterium elymi]
MRISRVLAVIAVSLCLGAAGTALTSCAADPGPTVVLKTADTGAGTVVVDADGRAVYLYDADEKGTDTRLAPGRARRPGPR